MAIAIGRRCLVSRPCAGKPIARHKIKTATDITFAIWFSFDFRRTASFTSIVPLEDQRSINTAEGEIVGHDIFAFEMPAGADNVVEIGTVRINAGKIDRRRKPRCAHHLDADP